MRRKLAGAYPGPPGRLPRGSRGWSTGFGRATGVPRRSGGLTRGGGYVEARYTNAALAAPARESLRRDPWSSADLSAAAPEVHHAQALSGRRGGQPLVGAHEGERHAALAGEPDGGGELNSVVRPERVTPDELGGQLEHLDARCHNVRLREVGRHPPRVLPRGVARQVAFPRTAGERGWDLDPGQDRRGQPRLSPHEPTHVLASCFLDVALHQSTRVQEMDQPRSSRSVSAIGRPRRRRGTMSPSPRPLGSVMSPRSANRASRASGRRRSGRTGAISAMGRPRSVTTRCSPARTRRSNSLVRFFRSRTEAVMADVATMATW